MKSLNTKDHLSILPFLFMLVLSFTHADNNSINGSCPGEIIEEMDAVTVAATHTENGAIGGGGNDRYRMTFPSAGTLSISATNRNASRNARYDFYVSRNCGNNDSDWDIQGPKVPRTTNYAENVSVNAGDTIWVRLQSRSSEPTNGRHSYALTLSFTPTPIQNTGAFTQKYTNNLKGNLKVIGNTILEFTGTIGTSSNAQLDLSYVDIDGVGSTFNSSSADIGATEAGVDITSSQIRWAGLYWQSYLHTWDANDGGNGNNRYTTLNTLNSINNVIDTHSISFTTPSGVFNVNPSEIGKQQTANLPLNFNGNQWNAPGYNTISYSCFADVTNLVQGQAPNGTYTVANIPSQQGRTSSVNSFNIGNTTWYDGLGNYGAWSLVVVYDNNSTATEKTRNITIFNGYTAISGTTNPTETIPLSGFKTPSSAPNGVDSTISIFAAEGDRNILGDYANLTNQDGYTYSLPDTSGAGSYFASVIEGVATRNPNLINNQGIDIHTIQVGTSAGADRPIKENQVSASLTLGTATAAGDKDTYFPSMIAFATELFTPDLCYDYDVRIGDHIKIPSDNREIHTNKFDDNLVLTMLIRSEISDFPIDNSKLNVTFTPTSPSSLGYIPNSSSVSPPDINVYHAINDIDSSIGQIGIGRAADAILESTGGTIGALENTFAKQQFNILGSRFDGTFDISVAGTIQFDPNQPAVPYTLSTAAPSDSPNHISRCDTNAVYDPVWGNFNIERTDSGDYDPSTPQGAMLRYPLYTQIAGQPFAVSIVSYTKDVNNNGEYTQLLDTNASVEVELIDASTFDNNASTGYDSTCEEPGALGNGAFKSFTESGSVSSRVNLNIPTEIPNFNNNIALQSVAFRLWVLSVRETNGTKRIINHSCTPDGNTPGCFQNLYTNTIKPYDGNGGVCQSSCEGAVTDQQCYDCLRENFATPICSRDNFAIRPESFRIRISDNNETNTTGRITLTDNSLNANNPNLSIAAGYRYAIDINSTLFRDTGVARAYYNENFRANSNLANLGDNTDNNNIAALEFNDNTACNDTTHRSFGLRLQNGTLDANTFISHHEVGDYNFWMLDSNWTNVDRSNYPNKVRFGDCAVNDGRDECNDCDSSSPSSSTRNADGKLGCVINSNIQSGDANTDNNYINIPLRFEPYSFNLSSINVTLPNNNNFVYTNNIPTGNIPNLSMAVNFDGNISAQNRRGNPTSNFTAACAASPVIFDINRTFSSGGLPINENSITATDIVGMLPQQRVSFQRNYINTNGNENFSTENNDTNGSVAFTVTANQFLNDGNGSARIRAYYNLSKSVNHVMNPVNINFISKEANATQIQLAAHLRQDFVPSGSAAVAIANGPVTRSGNAISGVDFYSGCLFPDQMTPYIAAPDVDTITVAMRVDHYCDDTLDCTQHTLPGTQNPNGWWLSSLHNSNSRNGDGKILNIIDTKIDGSLSYTPSATPIDLYRDANATNITFTIGSNVQRPYNPRVEFRPHQWLQYNACSLNGDGIPDTLFEFQGGGGWAGSGNTGLVVETNASYDRNNKRIEW